MNIVRRAFRKLGRYPVSLAVLNKLTGSRGRQVLCAGKWPLRILWRRSLSLDFQTWEAKFVDTYAKTLAPGDIVFDVGAEHGEWAALAGVRVGNGRNIHLFEPNRPAWAWIESLWKLNNLDGPGGCWPGFVSDPASATASPVPAISSWPVQPAEGSVAFESLKNPGAIPAVTIDDYVAATGCVPTVIKMDIEGAEALAIRGATNTLQTHKPLLFFSLHPELIGNFGSSYEGIIADLEALGYASHHISTDHEAHWVFYNPAGRRPAID